MRKYVLLNITDLMLGLDDLLAKRQAALVSTEAGKGQVLVLSSQLKQFNLLPPALLRRPLADELTVVDFEHDGMGAAIWHITEACERNPKLDISIKEAARRVRAAFVPERSVLQESYADEAAAAKAHKEKLESLKSDLGLITVPGGNTLQDWVVHFIGLGEQLSTLLSQRADESTPTRKNAQVLRSETIGILNDLRRAITREARHNDTLPKDIDAQIFSYFDTLEEQRVAANRAKTKGKPKTTNTEGT